MGERRPTAAVLLVGNELLTGKIRDENGYFLAVVLRRRGIELLEICTVPDEVETIAAACVRLLGRTPLVFTSGGVGPTHDDVTMEGVARASGRPIARDARMEAILRRHYEPLTESVLTMADVPEGTVLCGPERWPVLRLDLEAPGRGLASLPHDARIYILPGIPALLRAKVEALESIEGELPAGRAWTLSTLEVRVDESRLAPSIDAVVQAFPDVAIGSYPRWTSDSDGRLRSDVRVTFESDDPERARSARAALAARVAPEALAPEEPR